MFVDTLSGNVGDFEVVTSSNGGHPPEFWAAQAANRIVSVADTAHPAIREQANEFKKSVEQLVLYYIQRAISCDRTTVSHLISQAGEPKLAEHLRRL